MAALCGGENPAPPSLHESPEAGDIFAEAWDLSVKQIHGPLAALRLDAISEATATKAD